MSTDALWLASLEDHARARLHPAVHEYVVQGAREGRAAAAAVSSWQQVALHPHGLRDVTHVDPSAHLLGRSMAVPFGVAPTTLQRAVHPDGELAMARAVAAADGLMVVSSNAGTPFADLGETGVRWWVQCYVPADRTLAVPLLRRAADAGAEAVVLTIDTPVVGTKYARGEHVVWDVADPRWLRVNFDPGYDDAPGAGKALDLGPADIAWLRDETGLAVVAKGVLRPDTARAVVEAGAAAVWVSNHGGRQLDRAPTTASVLAAVRAELGDAATVLVDGGLRSGADVVTALALGADAVCLGRPPLWALVDGEAGVARLHAELLLQTVETMRLAGVRNLAETRSLVVPPVTKGL